MKINSYYQKRDKIISLLQEGIEYISQTESRIYTRWQAIFLCKRLASNKKLYIDTINKAISLESRIKSDITNFKDKSINDKHSFISDFSDAILEIYRVFRLEDKGKTTIFNTEDFYSSNISELQERERLLKAEIDTLKKENQEYAEKEKEIKEIKIQIQQSIEEKEELKKKLDAQENVKKSISNAFVELKKHITPLENEKRRLNWMFYSYAFLCLCILIALIYFEFSYLSKWEGAEKWIDYLPYYIPIPIVGGLLWAFIYQMNRAQRQLLQLANILYHIDYIEGLLLAINFINVDINSASEKISHVLDQMIKNYMQLPDSLSERVLDTEISKDSIKLQTFINLAKEIKDVIK